MGVTLSNYPPEHSTERELTEKYQEAMEMRDLNGVCPYLADDMTFEILPSTLIVVVIFLNSEHFNIG